MDDIVEFLNILAGTKYEFVPDDGERLREAAATITALRAALRECDTEIVNMYVGICNGNREAAENFAARSPAVLRARALLEPSDTERETTS